MSRKCQVITLSEAEMLSSLGLEGGVLLDIYREPDRFGEVQMLIEHKDLPEVQEGRKVPRRIIVAADIKPSSGLTERISSVLHEHWMATTKAVADKEDIAEDTLNEWRSCWVAYKMLPDTHKQERRQWAERVIKHLSQQ